MRQRETPNADPAVQEGLFPVSMPLKKRWPGYKPYAPPFPDGAPLNPCLFISCGEPSGDMHAAMLASALRQRSPDLQLTGVAGAGLAPLLNGSVGSISELSVMGFTEVLGTLPRIIGLLLRIRRHLRARRPDAVVLIDAPDFNFRVAKLAHGLKIPVFYYISPKLWAWRTRRAAFIKRYVRRMLCIFPFEIEFYRRHGVDAVYVGNPLADSIDWERMRGIEVDRRCIGLLPGSRRAEIHDLLPEFAQATRLLLTRRPELHFLLMRAPGITEQAIRALWPTDIPMTLLGPERRYEHIRRCGLVLAASGTATLETALLGTPTIVAYKLSRLTFALAQRLVKVKSISLPNIILDDFVFPELLQNNARGDRIAEIALNWLDNPSVADAIRGRLDALAQLLSPRDAPGQAADIILQHLEQAPDPVR